MNRTALPLPGAWEPLPPPPRLEKRNIFVGTSGYYFEDWVGPFYPPKRGAAGGPGERDRFAFYQRYFAFLELNQTFYREPDLALFLDLERRSHPGMLFAVKVHRGISHAGILKVDDGMALMERHVLAVSPLLETGRLFSLLVQLEDRRERSHATLDYLLRVGEVAVEKRVDVHLELRHASWHRREVLQAMKDAGIGICNTEIPPVGHAFPLKAYATTPKGYIRYSGRNLGAWYPSGKATTPKERLASRNARYDYLYSPQEVEERVEAQMRLFEKTDSMAIAYNNHFAAKAVLNASLNLELLKRRFDARHDPAR